MSKIQAVTVMTLDGFLPEPDNMLTQWVMNHRNELLKYKALPSPTYQMQSEKKLMTC